MPDLNENATSDVRIARQLGTLRLASIREVIKRYGFAAPSRREAEGSARARLVRPRGPACRVAVGHVVGSKVVVLRCLVAGARALAEGIYSD